MWVFHRIRALCQAITGRELKREVERNRRAADALDTAVREMLER
jgi:hypothetical protein